MSDIDAVTPTRSDPSTIHEEDSRDQDDAREAYLRQQLAPHANPLSPSELRGVHQELLDIRERRDARAYDAQKHAPAHDDRLPTYSPPGVDLATQLLIQSGGVARAPSVSHESAKSPATRSAPALPPALGASGLPAMLALQSGVLHAASTSPPSPSAMSERQIRAEIDQGKATILALKNFAPAELHGRLELLETELARRVAPPIAPVNTLANTEAVAQALAREHAYLSSVEGHFAPPVVRAEHERYQQQLVGELQHHAAEYAAQTHVQMQRLYAQLQAMGDTAGCRPGDTVESLEARRAQLSAVKQEQWDTKQQAADSMGLDGQRGTADAVAKYAFGEGVKAINPGTGTGVLFASLAAMRGGTVEDIRAAGEAGNALEDLGGGVGHTLNTNRPSVEEQEPSGRRRPSAGPGLGPRVRAQGTTSGVSVGSRERIPSAEPPTGSSSSRAAARAQFAAAQRVPSGNHWTAATEQEFVEQYRARYPYGDKSPAALHADYEAGQRIDPEGGMRDMRGAAVYATPPETLSADALPATRATAFTVKDKPVTFEDVRKRMDSAERSYATADAKYQALKKQGAPERDLQAARTAVTNASRDLGEVGAEAYVAARYPGPPPPELLYPAPGAPSRSGDFDRVYKVADAYGRTRIVVEAKGNSSQLAPRKVDGDKMAFQGTDRYLKSVIDEMAMSKNPDVKKVGQELDEFLDPKMVDYIEVRTVAGHPPTTAGRVFDTSIDTGTRP